MMNHDEKDMYDKKDTFSKIRTRSVEDFLENKLTTVWFKKGYSKSSVKEYVNHLLKEIDYQKENFKTRVKEVIDEKERLQNEKNILSQQLNETVESLQKYEKDTSVLDLQTLVDDLNEELEKVNAEKISVENNNEELTKQLEQLNDMLNDLESKNGDSELANTVNALKSDIEMVNSEKAALLDEKMMLSEKLEEANNKISLLESEEAKAKELEEVIAKLEEEIRIIKKSGSSDDIIELKYKLDESNKVIERLNRELDDEREKIKREINNNSAELLQKINHYKEENERLTEELNTTNIKLTSLQESSSYGNELVGKNIELQKNVDWLKSQLIEYDEIKNHNQMLVAEVLSLSRMTKELSAVEKESKLKIINLENHLNDEKNKYYEDLKKMTTEFEAERDYYNKLITSGKNELEEEIKQKNAVVRERRELQHRLSSCLEYLNELYDKVDYLKSSNNILQNQLKEQRNRNRKISGLDIPELSSEVIKNMTEGLKDFDLNDEQNVEVVKEAIEVKDELNSTDVKDYDFNDEGLSKVLSIK